jgi:heat shock protein HslJ
MYLKRLFFIVLITFALFTSLMSETKSQKPFSFYETHWRLVHLLSQEVNASGLSREAHIIFTPHQEKTGNFHGATGCNEMLGKYESTEENLSIDTKHIAMTRMACPDMQLEQTFLKTLGSVKQWKIENHTLFLRDANQSVIATFEAE